MTTRVAIRMATVVSAAAHQLTHGLADPPGLNRDDCRPDPRHPEPVIMVHGTGLNGGNS